MEGTPTLNRPKKPALSTVLTPDREALDLAALAEVTAGTPTGFRVDAGLGVVLEAKPEASRRNFGES